LGYEVSADFKILNYRYDLRFNEVRKYFGFREFFNVKLCYFLFDGNTNKKLNMKINCKGDLTINESKISTLKDKSVTIKYVYYSPRFKPWAISV
jgi:hypothetical protein